MNDNSLDDFFSQIYDYLLISLEEKKGGPFGAGLVLNDELYSIGSNEVLKHTDVSKHAEVVTLKKATQKYGKVHIPQGIFLSTHLPCLMCYHAIKWAEIKNIYYIYDYNDTQNLFSFKGDSNFLTDLGLKSDFFKNDPSVDYILYRSDLINDLYFNKLPAIWKSKYEKELSAYDISD